MNNILEHHERSVFIISFFCPSVQNRQHYCSATALWLSLHRVAQFIRSHQQKMLQPKAHGMVDSLPVGELIQNRFTFPPQSNRTIVRLELGQNLVQILPTVLFHTRVSPLSSRLPKEPQRIAKHTRVLFRVLNAAHVEAPKTPCFTSSHIFQAQLLQLRDNF